HTRSKRDWSSDVCSSDLGAIRHHLSQTPDVDVRCIAPDEKTAAVRAEGDALCLPQGSGHEGPYRPSGRNVPETGCPASADGGERSEERRVGKEWRSPLWT